MTNDTGKLSYKIPYNGNDMIYVGDGNCLPITYTGDAHVVTSEGKLNLKYVLVVPNLKKNLLFVGKFTSDNLCTFEFTSSGFFIKYQTKRTIARGHKRGQLYALDDNKQEVLSAIRKGGSSSSIWHQRLGHPNTKILFLLREKKVIDVTN